MELDPIPGDDVAPEGHFCPVLGPGPGTRATLETVWTGRVVCCGLVSLTLPPCQPRPKHPLQSCVFVSFPFPCGFRNRRFRGAQEGSPVLLPSRVVVAAIESSPFLQCWCFQFWSHFWTLGEVTADPSLAGHQK